MSLPAIPFFREEIMSEQSSPLESLRQRHQAVADQAAASGSIPEQFKTDPVFLDLVAFKQGDGGSAI